MNKHQKKQSFDSAGIGFASGFLVPVIIFFVVYFSRKQDISFFNFVKSLWHLNALVKLGSLCVFANLLVFYGFIRLKFDQSARGVLGATIIYALVILISKAF
ncbi:MAG: hypothetical protein PHS40_01165 [Mariniphaga sp.]|nr:hypothetical protein [Mariniphaga sp.]